LTTAQDLGPRVQDWIQKAMTAYAHQLRARTPEEKNLSNRRIASLWSENEGEPMYTLLHGSMAGLRGAEATFQLGLCKQEQAEKLQAHLDLVAGSGPHEAETDKAHTAWRDALETWNDYDSQYPKGPDQAAVRRLRGRAEQALGEYPAAQTTLKDVSGPMTELEKVAALYQSRRMPAKPPQ
jgi:hypothetical protein